MPMQVILLERIEKLGQMGDVVSVKPGYARNYLLPRKKALRATAENKKVFEKQKAQLEAQNLERRTEAEAVASKMDAQVIVLIRQAGEAGQLYGSVNARDLATALEAAGFTVARSQVELNKPIKSIGLHDVRVRLHPEVAITVTANVARTNDEAEVQLKTGTAVVGGVDDDEEDEAELAEALAAQANAVFEDTAAAEAVAEARAEAGEDEEAEGDAEKA